MENNTTTKEKKLSLSQRFNNWWEKQSPRKQVTYVCGLFFIDGVLWTSAIRNFTEIKKINKLADRAYSEGLKDGKIEAYTNVMDSLKIANNAKNDNH